MAFKRCVASAIGTSPAFQSGCESRTIRGCQPCLGGRWYRASDSSTTVLLSDSTGGGWEPRSILVAEAQGTQPRHSEACYNGAMSPRVDPIALLYDNDGFVEPAPQPRSAGTEPHTGPIGRKVAGKEFLDAFLTYGTWTTLVALVRDKGSTDTLSQFFQSHPSHQAR